MNIKTINLEEKFETFSEHWDPKIVGRLNGQLVKIARFKGEFVSHQHENEDEMFFVVEGQLLMEMEDRTLTINPGEFVIVPKGTVHKPIAKEEVKVMLFEPESTVNTGAIRGERTRTELEEI